MSTTPPEAHSPGKIAGKTFRLSHLPPKREKGRPLLVNVPYLDKNDSPAPFFRPLPCTIYRKGVLVGWGQQIKKRRSTGLESIRGRIEGMSLKSRLRAAWAYGNAPVDWWGMITLTFREQPYEPKKAFDKFTRWLRTEICEGLQWGWIMEYQSRGVVHYHIFLGADCASHVRNLGPFRTEIVTRRGKRTSIVRGAFDDGVVARWIAATHDSSSTFRAFQEGGIIELFSVPDAAARYVAKEAQKREQKALPEGVKGGNRWWWLSPAGKAVPIAVGRVNDWPLAVPLSRVFDREQLSSAISHVRPLAKGESVIDILRGKGHASKP